jgi:TRAP-type C4-dicarboxylate transport system permease small subunit
MGWTGGLKKGLLKTESGIFTINRVTATIAAVVLLGMMLLTVADVGGRYFFNSPIKGTWELVGLFLVFAGTWGLGYCQMERAHIQVDIILTRFSRRVRGVISSIGTLIGLGGFSLLCWRVYLLSYKYFTLPRGNVSDTLELPWAPFMLGLAIGTGLMALVLIIHLVRFVNEVVHK